MQCYNIPYTSRITNDEIKATKIYNNCFDGVRDNGFRNQEGGQGTEIKDNIFTNTLPHVALSQSGTGYAIADLVGSDLSINNNCFLNNANGNYLGVLPQEAIYRIRKLIKLLLVGTGQVQHGHVQKSHPCHWKALEWCRLP